MRELDELLDQLLGRHLQHAGADTDGGTWSALTETGLSRVGLDEALGGCGGDRTDAVGVTIAAAAAGLNVPLAEGLWTVSHLAALTATPVPSGIVSTATLDPGSLRIAPDGVHLTANCCAVPWAAAADEMWVAASTAEANEAALVRLVGGEWCSEPGHNLAGEPRDGISVDLKLPADRVRPLPLFATEDVELLSAMARSCQLLGALRTTLSLTQSYVVLRHQFHKPLAAHQVVRHQLATMAEEVAACEAAVSHASGRLPAPGARLDAESALAVAAAKVQTSRSATRVARAAHQLHGAIGLTAEYPLHHFSSRLWSWRDECGSASYWSRKIAHLVATEYDGDLWAALTAQSQPTKSASAALPSTIAY
jgi:acyl-CoA dehydrogenase